MMIRRFFDTPIWRTRSLDRLEQIRREMSRLRSGTRQAGVFPLINVTENKDSYFIRAELPGLKAEELDISTTIDSIAISGERKISAEDKNVNYHRREREAGKFSRMLRLPTEIDASEAEASMRDGILTVILPKAASAKPIQITIT